MNIYRDISLSPRRIIYFLNNLEWLYLASLTKILSQLLYKYKIVEFFVLAFTVWDPRSQFQPATVTALEVDRFPVSDFAPNALTLAFAVPVHDFILAFHADWLFWVEFFSPGVSTVRMFEGNLKVDAVAWPMKRKKNGVSFLRLRSCFPASVWE